MGFRRLLRAVRPKTRKPRFETPGGTLALILFLLAALLSILGSVADKPEAEAPSVPAPSVPAAPPEPVEPPVVSLPEEIPQAPAVEEPGAGCPDGCENPPSGCDIKGNTSRKDGERIYHVPGQQNYDDTIIESWKGERWFCTEEEAEANGWRRAKR